MSSGNCGRSTALRGPALGVWQEAEMEQHNGHENMARLSRRTSVRCRRQITGRPLRQGNPRSIAQKGTWPMPQIAIATAAIIAVCAVLSVYYRNHPEYVVHSACDRLIERIERDGSPRAICGAHALSYARRAIYAQFGCGACSSGAGNPLGAT